MKKVAGGGEEPDKLVHSALNKLIALTEPTVPLRQTDGRTDKAFPCDVQNNHWERHSFSAESLIKHTWLTQQSNAVSGPEYDVYALFYENTWFLVNLLNSLICVVLRSTGAEHQCYRDYIRCVRVCVRTHLVSNVPLGQMYLGFIRCDSLLTSSLKSKWLLVTTDPVAPWSNMQAHTHTHSLD